ncbi:MAG TPA: LamG-like jellyroll fold domain-containing protein, partial [Lacipirellula sp.]
MREFIQSPLRSFTSLACLAALTLLGVGAKSCHALNILLLTENNGSLTAEETARRNYLQSAGHTVAVLWDASSPAAYEAALATADVVYIPEDVSSGDVGYKLRTTAVGVVSEVPQLDDELGFATLEGGEVAGTQINIVDPAFGAGFLTIFNWSQPQIYLQGTVATGFHNIAQLAGGQRALGFIEAGSPLANTYNGNSLATGRRLRMPWGGDAFAQSSLNSYGYQILLMGVSWAGEKPLILHWKLDESSGTVAADSSTYARTGTVTGGSWVNAVRHRGAAMTGAGRVSVASLLNNQPYFSLAAWVKINSYDASGTDVISLGDRVVLRASSAGVSGMFFNGSTYVSVTHSADIADTGWRHVAVTFDRAADSLKLYIDGALVATRVETTAPVYTGGGGSTIVGAQGNGNTSFDLNGQVDDVRIYNKPLTDGEVRELYGLMGHFRLDEAAGAVASDSSGNGYDGTLAGAPGLAKPGVYNTAFGFSDGGTGDYVSIPNAVANKLTSLSVSFWIKSTETGEQAILSGSPPAGDNELLIYFGSGTQFRTYFHGVQQSWTIPTVADGKWQHYVVVSVAETNTTTVYRNGVSMGSLATSAGGTPLNIAAGGLLIGQEQDSVGGGFAANQRLVGDLDELRVYNRALQPEEIAELYGSVGHWKFDEGVGLTVLTGETGAGKSILVDALALLAGGRGASDLVRQGADR